MDELEVPEESLEGVGDAHYTLESEPLDYLATARKIATPVVVAELRRYSTSAGITPVMNTGENEYERGVQAGVRLAAETIRRRANRLEAQR